MNKEASDLFKQCNIAEISVNKKNLEIGIPGNLNVILVNNNNKYSSMMKHTNIKERYNSLMDILPIRIVYPDVEVFDLFGRLLSIKIGEINEEKFIISNFTYLLSYFLAKYYFGDKVYLSYYYSMLNLIKIFINSHQKQFYLSPKYKKPYFYNVLNYYSGFCCYSIVNKDLD